MVITWLPLSCSQPAWFAKTLANGNGQSTPKLTLVPSWHDDPSRSFGDINKGIVTRREVPFFLDLEANNGGGRDRIEESNKSTIKTAKSRSRSLKATSSKKDLKSSREKGKEGLGISIVSSQLKSPKSNEFDSSLSRTKWDVSFSKIPLDKLQVDKTKLKNGTSIDFKISPATDNGLKIIRSGILKGSKKTHRIKENIEKEDKGKTDKETDQKRRKPKVMPPSRNGGSSHFTEEDSEVENNGDLCKALNLINCKAYSIDHKASNPDSQEKSSASVDFKAGNKEKTEPTQNSIENNYEGESRNTLPKKNDEGNNQGTNQNKKKGADSSSIPLKGKTRCSFFKLKIRIICNGG